MMGGPPEDLGARHERELEIAAAEARLARLEASSCPYCGFDVESSFLRCPSCLRRLKEPCRVCGKPLDPRWRICPYCEAEASGGPTAAETRRRGERPLRASSRGGAGASARIERPARSTR